MRPAWRSTIRLTVASPIPVPGNLVAGVEALERGKETRSVGAVEACAVVSHEERGDAVDVGRADLDPRAGRLRCELPGVPEQVFEENLDEARVCLGGEAVFDDEGDLPARVGTPQPLPHAPRELREVHPLAMDLRPLHAREGEEVVDQLVHSLRRGANAPEVLSPLGVELVGAVFEQSLAESVDAPERRAQVVGHRVAERLELLVLAPEVLEEGGTRLRELGGGGGSASFRRRRAISRCVPTRLDELLRAENGFTR